MSQAVSSARSPEGLPPSLIGKAVAIFGQQGVARVLEMLNNELRLAMAGCGARSLKEITAALIDKGSRSLELQLAFSVGFEG